MMKHMHARFSFLSLFLALFSPSLALAEDGIAKPWQHNFQTPATDVMQRLYDMHTALTILITVITIFVLGLLAYVCVRFSAKRNPVPSKTTHNTLVEVVWTVLPIIILVVIAIPSLRLHYFMNDTDSHAEMTIKVTGYQWYWHYEYPDNGGFAYESRIVEEKDKDKYPNYVRLLTVDNDVVVPVDTAVRVQMVGGDVIHAWAIPAFGVKMDAVPGKLNETWFKANRTGTFYGQCSELCGVGHGFMPITVKVVTKEEFAAWVEEAKKKFVDNSAPASLLLAETR